VESSRPLGLVNSDVAIKEIELWTGFFWLRMWASSGLLWTW